MSTFNGIIPEFPHLRIDNFQLDPAPCPLTHPLASTCNHDNKPPPPAPLATLLSHVHTDHLRGLLTYRSPFIYCTPTTRSLLLRLTRRSHRPDPESRGALLRTRGTPDYSHLRRLLRPVPYDTRTEIELRPGEKVAVTAIEANHCPGACMWLVEGAGGSGSSSGSSSRRVAVLYTGDVRAEDWWCRGLTVRSPALARYVVGGGGGGTDVLDRLYLDTTFAGRRGAWRRFEGKDEGVAELLRKVAAREDDDDDGGTGTSTRYYIHAWTLGYEDVLVALAGLLGTSVHVDGYRWRLYRSIMEGELRDVREGARLVGFQDGNRWQEGALSRDEGGCRVHACGKGMGCEVLKDDKVVHIVPIVTRHQGVEYMELGAGGGHGGDLDDRVNGLEWDDIVTLGGLLAICDRKLAHRPDVVARVKDWLKSSSDQGARNVRLDTEAFYAALDDDDPHHGSRTDDLEDISVDRLLHALEILVSEKETKEVAPLERRITFPYSRHSSYAELRMLVGMFRPRSVYPNTYVKGLDMDDLFGDLLADRAIVKTDDQEPGVVGGQQYPDDEDNNVVPKTSAVAAPSSPLTQIYCTPDAESDGEKAMGTCDTTVDSAPDRSQGRAGDRRARRRRRREREGELKARQAIKRRIAAFESVLNSEDGSFPGLDLESTESYRQEGDEEVEL